MRLHPARTALCFVLGASLLSCKDALTSVKQPPLAVLRSTTVADAPQIVISQIYGGGGNSGATLKNDFIELFNRGSQSVSLAGWSVQYASAAGTTWQVTNLTGSIPGGGYYLVQEAQGSGGTQNLPTADATGNIPMSATAGKVAVVASTKALSGACPVMLAVDLVGFGTGSCDTAAPTLTNANSALRNNGGCANTGVASADFTRSPNNTVPVARNTSSATRTCPALGAFDHLTISKDSTIVVGDSVRVAARPHDATNQIVYSTTITWSTSDESIANVDATGLVRGVGVSSDPAVIMASATGDGITVSVTQNTTVKAPAEQTPGIHWIDVSSSSTSFPPGFQTQLFVTARNASRGTIIPANFTFEALDDTIATIAAIDTGSAIITGVKASTAVPRPRFRITATPKDGGTPAYTFITTSSAIEPVTFAPPSIYAKNDEFGDPTAASTSAPNDFLVVRPQYTLSYNQSRGTPNWVAYELDARQMVAGQDRCNCFTADPVLPADKQILTSDYTNGGFDRGHMARSADRTSANGDNATTFYLTNIVPQQADLNQGVWAQFENALGDSARAGRAVYIITGPLYSRSHELTFLKNQGKVAIPDSTWKVALIGPINGGNPFTRGNVQTWDDLSGLTILAVNMPNVGGVRGDPWSKYLTTVDKIETATGYDFLNLLDVAFQRALEAGDHAPKAAYVVTGTKNEGSILTFDASASIDPDLGRTDLDRTEALTYTWTFGDGTSATGRSVTHTFAKFGAYTAKLNVTDAFGWESTITQTLNIDDVAPVIAALANATLIVGESYSANVTFSDPGADVWNASVNYGDLTTKQLTNVAKTFPISHTYTASCTCTLTVNVSDDGGQSGAATVLVTVLTPLAATKDLGQQVQLLAESALLLSQDVQPLLASLDAATRQIQRGNTIAASNELGAFINKVTAGVLSGRTDSRAAQQLIGFAQRIQRAL